MIKALIRSVIPKGAYELIGQVYWRLWDQWHGVETCNVADINILNVVGNNQAYASGPYEPFGTIRPILKELCIDYEQYAFVDLGSGKGRILLEASGFPFKSVEGVEFSIELHRIAENNIRLYRHAKRRCGMVRSLLADATEFPLPTMPLVLFIFNPFTGPVLASVIDNVRQSALSHPRDLLIICAGTLRQKDAFDHIPNIQVIWRRKYSTVYRLNQGLSSTGRAY